MIRNAFTVRTITVTGIIFFAACNNSSHRQIQQEIVTNNVKAIAPSAIEKQDSVNVTGATAPAIVPLTVIVDHLRSPDAPVELSVFKPENKFPDKESRFKKYRFKPDNGKLEVKIKDLAYGEFALAVYQDINSDGKIDRDIIGMPKEPYGFSNNYKPVIKAPAFKNCEFNYSAEKNTVNISLIQ